MEIIRCTMEHLDTTAAFYDEVTAYLASHVNYPKWTPHIYPGRESTRQAISDGVQYLCMDVDHAVGAFILNNDPQGAYENGDWQIPLQNGEFLVIHTLAVSPSAYGQGVGKFIVDYCIRKATDEGYRAIRLDVVPENLPACRLYEKLGFAYAGEKDLLRNIEGIQTFKLYERILP